jgi:hypothetical protein
MGSRDAVPVQRGVTKARLRYDLSIGRPVGVGDDDDFLAVEIGYHERL